MKVIKLQEIINSVIPSDLPEEDFPFITDYMAHRIHYDKWFFRAYGLKDLYIDDIKNSSEWINAVKSVLYVYKEEIANFWNINKAEYSPVDNVFETRTETTNRDAHTDTLIAGAQTNGDTYGAQTNGDTYGARNDVENIGTSGKLGGNTSVTANSVIPTDSTTERMTDRHSTTVTNEELETTTSKGAQTDSHTIGARTDNHTIGEKTDTSTTGAQKEVLHVERHGNIGTTLSTDIMQGSFDFWSNYNFYMELFSLINKELFGGLWN